MPCYFDKVPFPTESMAQAEADYVNRSRGRRHRVVAFLCQNCGSWHVGGEGSDELRRQYDEADKTFHRIFTSYTPSDTDAKVARQFPDVLVLGTGAEDYMQIILRCAVTRLPIFVGDRVYISGDEHYRTYILADAVTLAPGFEVEPVIVNKDGEAA